jgi:hypothetical protein
MFDGLPQEFPNLFRDDIRIIRLLVARTTLYSTSMSSFCLRDIDIALMGLLFTVEWNARDDSGQVTCADKLGGQVTSAIEACRASVLGFYGHFFRAHTLGRLV